MQVFNKGLKHEERFIEAIISLSEANYKLHKFCIIYVK